jgi:hypothetical protein
MWIPLFSEMLTDSSLCYKYRRKNSGKKANIYSGMTKIRENDKIKNQRACR